MTNIEEEYLGLMAGVLQGGRKKADRTGTGTLSVFGRIIRHDMSLGFPLLTTKNIYFNHALTELLWILNGRTDLDYLHKHGVHYWDADYKRDGRTDGKLGLVYGHQWRNFGGIDQLAILVRDIKKNPTSRRLLVSAWNPSDLNSMVLPPCHYGFQVYINDIQMDLMWQQRSADIFLGLPYDIAMYGLLLEMLAKGAQLKAGQLIGNLGDCHLYNNHIQQAELQLSRSKKELPNILLNKGISIKSTKGWKYNKLVIPKHKDININNYKSHPNIKAELSVGT
jgi:thymidylate synthase